MPRHTPAAVVTLASLVLLTGCANPNIPDFMVEGRLPDFAGKGHDKDQENVPPPAPVLAEAPPAPAPAPLAANPAPKPAAQPTPAVPSSAPSAPVAVKAAAKPAPEAPRMAATPAPQSSPTPKPPRPEKVKRGWFHADPTPEPVITGGFSPVTDKATISHVTDFAMGAAPNGYLLKSVKSMKGQVVAGVNYELCLRVRTPGHESSWIRRRLVKAVVWQHLDQTLELTSWNEVETCE